MNNQDSERTLANPRNSRNLDWMTLPTKLVRKCAVSNTLANNNGNNYALANIVVWNNAQ